MSTGLSALLVFATAALLMAAAALAALTAPLWWPARVGPGRSAPVQGARRPSAPPADDASSPDDANDAALAVLRDQLRELDRAHQRGEIDTADWEVERRALSRRALTEADGSAAAGGRAHGAATALHDHHGPDGARSRAMAWSVALAALAVALTSYLVHGRTDATALAARPFASAPQDGSLTQVESMVMDMARELEARARAGESGPDEAPAWEMLARALASLQRFDQADRAYRQAIERDPSNPRLLADRADVLRAVEGDNPSDEPRRLVERALRLDPQQPKALALAGRIAYEQRDFRGAIAHWQRAQAVAPAGSELAQGLERGIAQAQAALQQSGSPSVNGARPGANTGANTGGILGVQPGARPLLGAPQPAPSAAVPAPATPSAAQAQTHAAIAGRIDMAPALRSQARPDDIVFVVARATAASVPAGSPVPRMPVAILRLRVADLPARFEIDDRQAMSPELRPSQFTELSVTARVARSGDAMPVAGDFISEPVIARRGERDLALRIARVQP